LSIVICLPFLGSGDRYITPGSTLAKCADCGAGIFVAPSSQEIPGENVYVCMDCAARRLREDPAPKMIVVERAIPEIQAWRRRN